MSTEESVVSIPIPPKVKIRLEGRMLVGEGPLGTVARPFPKDAINVAASADSVTLTLLLPPHRRESKALLRTWVAHVNNIAGGVSRGVEARMKIVAAHFPMKVAAKGSELVIENFLGEKHPRSAPLLPGTKATVEGEFVLLAGNDVEQVGQSAANIERATHIRDYDPRVFQDGIYLIESAHLKEAS